MMCQNKNDIDKKQTSVLVTFIILAISHLYYMLGISINRAVEKHPKTRNVLWHSNSWDIVQNYSMLSFSKRLCTKKRLQCGFLLGVDSSTPLSCWSQ